MPENDRSDGDRSEDFEDDPYGGETSEELRDFLESEYFEEMGDDLLLDQLGRGEDNRTIYDAPDDDDLQDAAHDWRESIEDTPLPESTSPDAVMAEFERRKKAAVPPGPRTPESGGTPRMAINEDAQIIRAAAENSSLSGAAQLALSSMGDVQPVAVDRLADAVGALQEGLAGLEDNANAAAAAAGGEDEQAIRGAAGVATEAVNAAVQASEQARGLAEQLNAAIQGAHQAAESALAASEQFRQTCDGIASRHGA